MPVPVSRFSYVAAPVVTGISQPSGSTRGGTAVTLTGTNFTGVTAVFFGTTPARSFRVLSPTQITVIVPARLPGTVNVRLVAAGGSSPVTPATRFTYVAGSAAGLSSAPAGGSGPGALASDPLEPFRVDVVMALQDDADSEQP